MECAALASLPGQIAEMITVILIANLVMFFIVQLAYDTTKNFIESINFRLERRRIQRDYPGRLQEPPEMKEENQCRTVQE